MADLWWLFAIIASFVFAMFIFSNQVFQLKGSLVMIYRGLGTALVLAPFAFFVPIVEDINFYYFCILQGFVIAYLDNRLFNAAKKYGAEITAIIQPISVLLIFTIWLSITPTQLAELTADTTKLTLTISALLIIAYSVIKLKKSPINKKAFKYLFPALCCVALIDVLGKELMTMGEKNVFAAIFYYSLITSFIAGLSNLIIFLKYKNNVADIFNPRHIICVAIPIIILILSMYFFKNYSLFLSTNPAYVMAIIYTYPIWILLSNNILNRFHHNQDYAKPNKSLIAMIICAVIMLILVA